MQRFKIIALFPSTVNIDYNIGDEIVPLYNDKNQYYIHCLTGTVTDIKHPEKYPHLFMNTNPDVKCDCDSSHCVMSRNIGKTCKYKNVLCDPEYFKY